MVWLAKLELKELLSCWFWITSRRKKRGMSPLPLLSVFNAMPVF